jgi:RimJ/RimL family protein N-acetyltransferase
MPRRFPDDVPVLTDGAVTLRAHAPADLDRIVEQSTDPVSLRFTTVPRPYTRQHAGQYLEHVRQGWEASGPTSARSWAIGLGPATAPGPFAGTIDYRPTGAGTAEVGFGLHPGARGHGAVEKALRLVLGYAFDDDGIELMHWQAVVGNWASRRIAWRCGFRLEGTVRMFGVHPDGAHDCWIGSLHRTEERKPCEPWPAEVAGS